MFQKMPDGLPNGHLRCVKCGDEVEQPTYYYCQNHNLPSACNEHIDEVIEEIDRAVSMWPSGWYGHWWKNSGEDRWRHSK